MACLRIAVAVIVAAILCGGAYLTPAAQTSDGVQPDENAQAGRPERPLPIPASQMTARAEEVSSLLRGLRGRPVHDDQIDIIEHDLPRAFELLYELTDLTDQALSRSVSSRMLEDLDRRWHRARSTINGWRSRAARNGQAIDRDLEALMEQRELWEVTLESMQETGTQESVTDLIAATLGKLRQEEERFGEHRARLLNLGMQINQAENLIADAFDRLEVAKRELRVRLFALDTPPLWSIFADPPPRTNHVAQIKQAASESARSLKEFVDDYREQLIVHLLALIALFFIIRSLKKRVEQLQLTDPELEDSIRVVSKPFSSALLLALAGLLVIYRNPPRIVDEFTTILCFLPLYQILPRKVFRHAGKLLVWLISLHIVDRVTDILPHLSLLKRMLLLLLTAVSFAVVLRAIRNETARRISGAPNLRSMEIIAAGLLIVSFGANIIGDLSLADVIVSAVISAAYFGLVLYSIYLVLDAVLRIGAGTHFARKLRMVRRHADLVHSRIMTVLRIVLRFIWLAAALYWLQILPVIVQALKRVLSAEAHFGSIPISLGGILAFVLTVWIAFMLSRVIRFILDEDVFPRSKLPRGVPNAISTGLHYIILLLAFILAVAATGVDLGKFAILAGAFGVGIGFGLQNVVNNFISGLILIVERPIMPGDTVEFGNRIGDVKRIGLRSSTIRTWSGAEVIVPNGNLISSEVTNWTLSDRQRRLDIPVGVAYGSPVKHVMEILAAVAVQHAEVLENPAPRTLFMSFGNSSLDFELRCWTVKFENFRRIKSDLIVGIEAALNEAGITIPFPQRDLHIKTLETKVGRTIRGEEPTEEIPAPEPVEPELPRVPRKPQLPPQSNDPAEAGDGE